MCAVLFPTPDRGQLPESLLMDTSALLMAVSGEKLVKHLKNELDISIGVLPSHEYLVMGLFVSDIFGEFDVVEL